MPLSNDTADLVPRVPAGAAHLEFDLPGLSVGVAEYDEGPTGCTVFLFEKGWQTAIDVRGGLVGMTGSYEFNHGIVFAGGSLLGLEAATGVTAELFSRSGYAVPPVMGLVSGAIIYDYAPRKNSIYPDKTLGRAAARAAQPGLFPLGARGAGRLATCGKAWWPGSEPSGQGAAFGTFAGARILVCTVVNAVGAVLNRDGEVVRGNRDATSGLRISPEEALARRVAATPVRTPAPGAPTTNTTLTLVATDARLDRASLTQLGRQVHSSMARAIVPFHTPTDGDVLFTVTSNTADGGPLVEALGYAASELAWDAVLSAVGNAS